MKKTVSSLLAVLLTAALLVGIGVSAFADDTDPFAEPAYTGNMTDLVDVVPSADRLLAYTEDGYVMYDFEGNALTDAYAALYEIGTGCIEFDTDDGMEGIMDGDGSVIIPAEYGYVEVDGPFVLCCTLRPAESDTEWNTAGFDENGEFVYWDYDTVTIVSLTDGEVKAEIDGDDFSMIFWTDGVLEVCDGDLNAVYYDADFNELTEDEAFDLAYADSNEYYTDWDADTDSYGLVDAEGNTVLETIYDNIYLSDDGMYLVNGFLAAGIDDTIYFFDGAGNEVAEFSGIDPENGISFYGSSMVVYDDYWDARTVLNADGSRFDFGDDYEVPAIAGTVDGELYLTALDADDYRCTLFDSCGNALITADYIFMTDDGCVICWDSVSGDYAVYCLGSEAEA